jgi:chaperonin GroEL (HSP60 family)
MLFENILKLDSSSGFASFISTLASIKMIKRSMLASKDNFQKIDIDESLHIISQASRHASLDVAIDTIKNYCSDSLASSMLLQACVLTGHSGQIYVDSSPSTKNSIELTNGYTFQFGLEENFCASSKTNEWKEYSPKVIIIDGVIETVGEINRVLEYCHNENSSCIIFARGFSEEVLGTLSVNKARETLNVVPVLVPFDLEGINSLVDLAVICDTEIVSSIKGDAISAIDPYELATVDYINASTNSITITNESTKAQVQVHSRKILERKNETSIQDKKDLYNKRVKSLSSVCTNIKIAGKGLEQDILKLRIQHGINMLKHICRFGCINLNNISEIEDACIKDVINELVAGGINTVSSKEFALGIKCAEAISNNVLSSSVYLTIDGDSNDR